MSYTLKEEIMISGNTTSTLKFMSNNTSMYRWIDHTYQNEEGQRVLDSSVRSCSRYANKFAVLLAQSDIDAIKAKFGLDHEVKLEQQELLMYKPGGHFDLHTDRYREMGQYDHIGTLIIATGSDDARGGGLEVNGKIVMPARSKTTAYYISLDTEHRVVPLQAGTRLVVKFGVYRKGPTLKTYTRGRKD